jgi:hypothetical protein
MATEKLGYELMVLPVLKKGAAPIPEAYPRAVERWGAAVSAFEAKSFDQAASAFFAAADTARKEDSGAYRDAFANLRALAYQNAAIAFLSAEKKPEGRAKLSELVQKRPADERDLASALRILGP